MTYLGTQRLTTERLVLRCFTMDDADAVYQNWASDPIVTQFLSWETHPDTQVTREVLKIWVALYENDGYYNWGIELSGVLIGAISVNECDEKDQNAEVGYCLARAYWGRGIMTEALSRVLRFLFEEVGLHRVKLECDRENIGSERVMRKNGLTYEGTLRENVLRKDGTWGDMRIYAMLRDEWMKARKGGC